MSSSVTPGSSDVARLQALQQLSWVDAPPDATLDQLVELAAWTFNVPMVTLSLFDDPHVVHKAHAGLPSDALAQPLGLGMQDIVGKGFLVVSDARSQPSMSDHPWVTGSQGVRFFASVALTTSDGHNVGAMSVMDTHARELSDHEARILTAMARLAMDHMSLQTSVRHMATLNAELEQAHGWLLESVAQDSLTQVANRRALMSFIEKTLALARREAQPLSILLIDLRQFKRINESYGDTVGDKVLREVAARLAACSRGSELVGRMSGDEFMAVLYPCTLEQAKLAAERYATAASSRPVVLGAHGGHQIELTLATGVSTADHSLDTTPDELYRQAALDLDTHKCEMVD